MSVTTPLSCFCGYGNDWRQSGSGHGARCCRLVTAWCLTHASTSLMLLCSSWHAMLWGVQQRQCQPKSALPEISLQSPALLPPTEREHPLGDSIRVTVKVPTNTVINWAAAAVHHVIVFCCSCFLIVLDWVPETRVLHWKWQPAVFCETPTKT